MKLACGASALRLEGVRSLSHAIPEIQGVNMAASRGRQGCLSKRVSRDRGRRFALAVARKMRHGKGTKAEAEVGELS